MSIRQGSLYAAVVWCLLCAITPRVATADVGPTDSMYIQYTDPFSLSCCTYYERDIETYVTETLPNEWYTSDDPQTLQAGAVIIRSGVWWMINRSKLGSTFPNNNCNTHWQQGQQPIWYENAPADNKINGHPISSNPAGFEEWIPAPGTGEPGSTNNAVSATAFIHAERSSTPGGRPDPYVIFLFGPSVQGATETAAGTYVQKIQYAYITKVLEGNPIETCGQQDTLSFSDPIFVGLGKNSITVQATLDGAPWPSTPSSAELAWKLSGPTSLSSGAVPATFSNEPAGTYAIQYLSGGPTGAAPDSVLPAPSQTLNPSGSITFTFHFSSGGSCQASDGRAGVNCALSVSLASSRTSGTAPLNGVSLTATVTGSPSETINYTFYCNRPDTGTNITTPYDWKLDGIFANPYTDPVACNYTVPGTYYAKVIAEQGTGAVQSQVQINVTQGAPTCYALTLARNTPSGGGLPTASPPNSTGCAAGQYTTAQVVQLTASPASGWSVGSWTGTQSDGSTSTSNSVVMPAAPWTATANYVQSQNNNGSLAVNATLDGVTWNGGITFQVVGPGNPFSGASVPTSFIVPVGAYTVNYITGGPPGAQLTSITPASTQSVGSGGTATFTLNFTSAAQTGTLAANATLDGVPWSGPITFQVAGPIAPFSGASVPTSFIEPAGTYSLQYISGGPSSVHFQGIAPAISQNVVANGTTTFTFQFVSQQSQSYVWVQATMDGAPWTGNLSAVVNGPTVFNVSSAPATDAISPGTYTVQYLSGGPPHSALAGYSPSATQSVALGATIIFTINFQTAPMVPSVTTAVADGISAYGATLHAGVTPNGAPTVAYFEYGPSSAYGGSTPQLSVGSGWAPASFAQTIAGLACGTTYHYRIDAQNSTGANQGLDQSFTTSACPPPQLGTINVNATLDGVPWPGAVNYQVTGPGAALGGSAVPRTFPNISPGTYSVQYLSGGPSGTFIGVVPSSQGVNGGGTANFTLQFASQTEPQTGTLVVNATLDGVPWSGAVSYQVTGPEGFSPTSTGTFPNVPVGSYTVSYLSGGPTGNFAGISPGPTQTLFTGGTTTFTLQFTSQTGLQTGTIIVNATLDGLPWSGAVSYALSGPESFSRTNLGVFPNLPVGAYTVSYTSGGPATFTGISPAVTQTLLAGNTITFTLAFNVSSAPATVNLQAALDGSPWSGALAAYLSGPSPQFATALPASFVVPPGSYAAQYDYGGPPNAQYTGVSATPSATAAGGGTITFTYTFASVPSGAPLLNTESAVEITGTTAAINEWVNPQGLPTVAYFEYGATTGYGWSTTPTSVGSGTQIFGNSASLTDLTCGTTYHYRAVASNAVATGHGQDVTFTTLPCGPAPGGSLYLNNNRFQIQVQWAANGQSGSGTPVQLTADTGYFWFFSPSNVEIVIKVLDACGPGGNNHFWVFAGGLTNVQTNITVTDTVSGAMQTYSTPSGPAFQPIQDTSAFSCSGSSTGDSMADTAALQERVGHEVETLARTLSPSTASKSVSCGSSPTSLCVHNGRFQIDVQWVTSTASGVGNPVALTADTGYFWFFSPSNVEIVIKVLDACTFQSPSFWVFAGGLTNVETTITVTDTETGIFKVYRTASGPPFQPIQDTNAFATCP